MGKYDRTIIGDVDGQPVAVTVDVYDVLTAFAVTDPALQHLTKKALCAGLRGHKDQRQDLTDIVDSAEKALKNYLRDLEIYKERKADGHNSDGS